MKKNDTIHPNRFKDHKHYTCLDYGTAKSQCLFFQTREWDKKQRCWKPLISTIVDVMENLRNFPQISTGLHHYERQIIVVDIDNERWQEFESCWIDKFPQFSYRLENPQTHHVQYGWLLTEPLSNKDNLFKAIKKALPKTINQLINNAFETEGKLADEAFTGWRCKNPLYEKFTNVILNLDRKTTVEELLGCVNINKVPETVSTNKLTTAIKKVASDNKISNALTSRNDFMVNVFGEEIWKIFKNKGKDVNYAYIKKVGLQFAKDAGYITGKGQEELSIVERQIKDIYEWRYKNFDNKSSYNEIQLRMSLLHRKYNLFKKIVDLINQLNGSNENNCLSPFSLLYTSEPGLKYSNVKFNEIVDLTNRSFAIRFNKIDKQELRNNIEEYKERLSFAGKDNSIEEELAIYDSFFETVDIKQYEIIKTDSPKFEQIIEQTKKQNIQQIQNKITNQWNSVVKESKIVDNGFEFVDLEIDNEEYKSVEYIEKELFKML